jgi:hypothetical protein
MLTIIKNDITERNSDSGLSRVLIQRYSGGKVNSPLSPHCGLMASQSWRAWLVRPGCTNPAHKSCCGSLSAFLSCIPGCTLWFQVRVPGWCILPLVNQWDSPCRSAAGNCRMQLAHAPGMSFLYTAGLHIACCCHRPVSLQKVSRASPGNTVGRAPRHIAQKKYIILSSNWICISRSDCICPQVCPSHNCLLVGRLSGAQSSIVHGGLNHIALRIGTNNQSNLVVDLAFDPGPSLHVQDLDWGLFGGLRAQKEYARDFKL